MKSSVKIFILFLVLMGVGAGLVIWKTNYSGGEGLTKISKEQMEMLVKDLDPMQQKMLAESPEGKKEIAKNLGEFLSIASQARKEGYAEKPEIKQELENIKKVVLAINYDKEINKDKGPMPPLSRITEDQIKAFWEADKQNEEDFEEFKNAQVKLAQERGQLPKDTELNEDQLKQMRESFAKLTIYANEANEKLASIGEMDEAEREKWKKFEERVEFQTKLQQSQLLAQFYAKEKLVPKLELAEGEVDKYIEEHPELIKEKKEKADEVLKKVNEGGDFAELAKEYSDDPGSKESGGLFEDVPKGQMVPEFEKAALALKPGETTKELVKTKFGYHIIKLEKMGEKKGEDGKTTETYDARHILISTTYKDPENPMAPEMPLEAYVTNKLKQEKQDAVLADIMARNPVEIATDFEVKPPPMPEGPQLPGGMQLPPPPKPDGDKSETPEDDKPTEKEEDEK
ncbi:MAG: hypothetical protein HKN25_14240 [Pyrinomonadaceae bacterium]|nr:hypothetical protein [Pyrinomonadaceae bacterium]